jgi:hypothetical protein
LKRGIFGGAMHATARGGYFFCTPLGDEVAEFSRFGASVGDGLFRHHFFKIL